MKTKIVLITIVMCLGVYLLRPEKKEITFKVVNTPPIKVSVLNLDHSKTHLSPIQNEDLKPAKPIADDFSKTVSDFKVYFETFSALEKKILKTEDENKQWKDLLNDKNALSLAQKLFESKQKKHYAIQDQALEFAVDAMKAGDPQALSILKSLITDSRIEDNSAEPIFRQQSAELKAQALYELSNYLPEETDQIAALLPGPVSRGIWQNVISHQDNNLAESALEVD